MEEARQRATEAAKKSYHRKTQKVTEFVREWPTEMTNEDLKTRCLLRASDMGFKPRSFKTKVVRLGLIAYEPKRKVWVNRSQASN